MCATYSTHCNYQKGEIGFVWTTINCKKSFRQLYTEHKRYVVRYCIAVDKKQLDNRCNIIATGYPYYECNQKRSSDTVCAVFFVGIFLKNNGLTVGEMGKYNDVLY